jgi:SAM-dependent methyltransferase
MLKDSVGANAKLRLITLAGLARLFHAENKRWPDMNKDTDFIKAAGNAAIDPIDGGKMRLKIDKNGRAIFYSIGFDSSDKNGESPGDNQSTKRALKMVRNLTPDSKILDIGCGPGRQTIELAKSSVCHVTALDNHQPFLDKLVRKAENEKLADRITTVNASMFDMKFSPNSFDLIWSEGAIYIYGFEKGLRDWKKMLTEDGYIVVSELSWLTPEMPE